MRRERVPKLGLPSVRMRVGVSEGWEDDFAGWGS